MPDLAGTAGADGRALCHIFAPAVKQHRSQEAGLVSKGNLDPAGFFLCGSRFDQSAVNKANIQIQGHLVSVSEERPLFEAKQKGKGRDKWGFV